MEVVLTVDDMSSYSELIAFITRECNGKIKLIKSTADEVSNTIPEQDSYLDKLLRDYPWDRVTPSRVGDPYPGYEPIPYWLRPDYVGPKPGDVIYGVNTAPTHRYTDQFTTTGDPLKGSPINYCDSSTVNNNGTTTAKN